MISRPIRSLLIANRGEIAVRVMRAATEMGIRTVAVYATEDRFSLHRFKADESYLIGLGEKPIAAYLNIAEVIRVAKQAGVDAIHPGYGFLSENPDFADACAAAGIAFVGPSSDVMRTLGNKVAARNLAQSVGVPVMPATPPLPQEAGAAKEMARQIGYPVMLKASWGGGGRGMRIIANDEELITQMPVARSEALSAFGNDEIYLEKLVQRARHVEVQILGDTHGHLVHLFERDCSVQRRNQKVVERAPAPYLDDSTRQALCDAALRLGRAVNYTHAGTVEFLMDADSDDFYFIEVNPRIQVEHTVTEQVTGIDLVKAQIAVTQGAAVGVDGGVVPAQQSIRLNGHALQCRVTTEDAEKNFAPDYGRLSTYRSSGGFGVRLDSGTAYSGAVITPYYDSLLVKVTTWGATAPDAIARMDRTLREFRIRGVATNLPFLENVIAHPLFQSGECTTRFIDQTPELLQFSPRQDRATKLLKYLGNVTVNGHPEMKGRVLPTLPLSPAVKPECDLSRAPAPGTRDLLRQLGTDGFMEWIKASSSIKKVLPSLMKRSAVLKAMYSRKVYGAKGVPGAMASKNFKDFAWWVPDASDPAVPVEPYELLRRHGADLLGEEVRAGEDPDALAITEGGAAATAYARLQFEDVDALTRSKIREALLRYCELDTLAMVMIVQGWRGLLSEMKQLGSDQH